MEYEKLNRRVKESLDQFEHLPDIQASGTWYDTLNHRLLASSRKRKVRPALVLSIILLVAINAGVVIKKLLPGSTTISQTSHKLELVAENLLFNPDSANN